jgi:hypothetical protein
MKLPFIAKGDVEINQLSDELIVRIGGFKKYDITETSGFLEVGKSQIGW